MICSAFASSIAFASFASSADRAALDDDGVQKPTA